MSKEIDELTSAAKANSDAAAQAVALIGSLSEQLKAANAALATATGELKAATASVVAAVAAGTPAAPAG